MHSDDMNNARGYLRHEANRGEVTVEEFGWLARVLQDPVSQFAYVLSCSSSCTLGDAWHRAAWGEGDVLKLMQKWVGHPKLFWCYRLAVFVCLAVFPQVDSTGTYTQQLPLHILLMFICLFYVVWEFAALVGHFTLMDKDAERRRCWFYSHSETVGHMSDGRVNTFFRCSCSETHRIAALGVSNEAAAILTAEITGRATFTCMVLGKQWRIDHYYQKGGWIFTLLRTIGLIITVSHQWRPSSENGTWFVGVVLAILSIGAEFCWSPIVYRCCGEFVCECCFCDSDE